MSRREIVVLVSRVLAVIEAVAAFLEISHLPGYLGMLLFHLERVRVAGSGAAVDYYSQLLTTDRVDIAFLILRIGVLLVLTLLFWKCGPGVSNFLLPPSEQPQDSSQPAEA